MCNLPYVNINKDVFGVNFFVLFLCNNYVIPKALPTSVLKDHAIRKEGYHGGNVCNMDYVIFESSLIDNKKSFNVSKLAF